MTTTSVGRSVSSTPKSTLSSPTTSGRFIGGGLDLIQGRQDAVQLALVGDEIEASLPGRRAHVGRHQVGRVVLANLGVDQDLGALLGDRVRVRVERCLLVR